MRTKADRIVSKADAAARIGISVRTLERRSADGTGVQIVNQSVGTAGVFESDLQRFLAKLKHPTGGDSMAQANTTSIIKIGLALDGIQQSPGLSRVHARTGTPGGACNLRAGTTILIAGDDEPYELLSDAIQPAANALVKLHVKPCLRHLRSGGELVSIVATS